MKAAERHAAMYAVRKIWKQFGSAAVRIDPKGTYWHPLRDAEKLGWCKWSGDRAALTPTGAALATEYEHAGTETVG